MTRPSNRRSLFIRLICQSVAIAAIALIGSAAANAAPTITNLSLRGLQAGGATTIVIDGTDLEAEPQIVLSVPIAKQELKQPATATRIERQCRKRHSMLAQA